ncbi:MAG TPA: radical SAM protein [Casimicrobiaceae bacterium]|nr:radical SAM protein [Casimicrobiaceae bacterium]
MNNGRSLRFLLINPTAPRWRVPPGGVASAATRFFRFSMLSSLYVAAALPPDVTPTIADEEIEAIDFDADADLVGISFMTFNAPRAYEIADRFRAAGKTVVVGGYHPSLLPDEAQQHADCVCVGEAEGTVPQMIADFRRGELKDRYVAGPVSLAGLPVPDRSLVRVGRYAPAAAVQATRGCPNTCSFCSITSFFHHRFRTRPVDEVIAELRTLGRHLLFMDDNLTANRAYALALFERMQPLRKTWFSQCSIRIAYDDRLLAAAAASGCRGLFIGLESLSQDNLAGWNKKTNKASEFEWAIRRIHDHGIGVVPGIVLGYDGDTRRTFDETLEFLLRTNVDALQATILTPFPGTPLFAEMERQGRIVDRDWSHYDFRHVVFEPKQVSAAELQAGHDRVLSEFYSLKNSARRFVREVAYLPLGLIAKAAIPLNFSYRTRLTADGTMH